MKKIICAVLILVLSVTVLSGCGKVTMDDILEDTNVIIGKVGSMNVYAYEMIYYMRMGATKEQAKDALIEVKVLQEQAIENGIEIDETIEMQIEEMYKGLAEQMGGEEAVIAQLSEIGVTKDQYTSLAKSAYHAQAFIEKFQEKGIMTDATDEEVKAFFDTNCLKAKHILFSTINEDRTSVSEEDALKKRTEAYETYEKIKAGEAFEKFEDLNEDPGAETMPEGYILVDYSKFNDENILSIIQNSAFSFDENFVKGAASVKVDEVAEIVESYAGYHIIKRVALTEKDFEDSKDAIKSIISSMQYQRTVDNWENSTKVSWQEKYIEALEVSPVSQ